jgi:outer membrane protein assembly factor BamB
VPKNIWFVAMFLFIVSAFFIGCGKNDDDNNNPDDNADERIVWSYQTIGSVYSSKPWVEGNSLYISSTDDDALYALNTTNGSLLWRTEDSVICGTWPIVCNGEVLASGYNFHGFNSNSGNHEWEYLDPILDPALFNSPEIANGKIYIGHTFKFFCLDTAARAEVWRNEDVHPQNMALAKAAVSGEYLVFGNILGELICLNASTGAINWFKNYDGTIDITPTLDVPTEKIYFGLHTGLDSTINTFFCLDVYGNELWGTKINLVMNNATLSNNKLYVVGGFKLYCIDTGGLTVWSTALAAGSISQPAVSDGKVYVGDGDEFSCFDAYNGTLVWRYYTADDAAFGSPTIVGNRLYVGSDNGKVYCFKLD